MLHPLHVADRGTSADIVRSPTSSSKPPASRWWAGVTAALLALVATDAMAAISEWKVSSNRILVRGGGSANLTYIRNNSAGTLPAAALQDLGACPTDRGGPAKHIWLLTVNIDVEENTTLDLSGDVCELRLQSNPSADPVAEQAGVMTNFIAITADPGTINVNGTKIVSWVTNSGCSTDCFDTNATDGRAFLRARSKDGTPATESRMDILNSEIAYLGWKQSESYGLSWKVNDSAANPNPPDLFERVNVWGDVINSEIHHNFFGIYSWGLQSANWINNNVHHNIGYGIDAHDDSDDLTIEGNTVTNNGANSPETGAVQHGIILSKRCDGATIRNNISTDNLGVGIMLHVQSDNAQVVDNVSSNNGDAGIAVFCSHNNTVSGNTVAGNGLYGIRLTVGSHTNTVSGNTITNTLAATTSGGYGIYLAPANDTTNTCPDPDAPTNNTFANNTVSGSATSDVKVKDSVNTVFNGNNIAGHVSISNATSSTELVTTLAGNTLGSVVELDGDVSFPVRADISGSDVVTVNVKTGAIARFLDTAGAIFDLAQDFYVSVTGSGSQLDLTTAQIGSANTPVTRRPLLVSGSTGEVAITTWETSGEYRKSWLTQNAGGSLNYSVGDLQSGVAYDAKRGDTVLGSFVADAGGTITFADAPGTTNATTYSIVKSAVQPQGGGGAGGDGGGGALDGGLLALLGLMLARRLRGRTRA